MFHMLLQAPSHAVSCLIYERLIQESKTEIECICARWGIPFLETMLKFKHSFGSGIIFSSDHERSIYCEKKLLDILKTVEASSAIEPDVPYHVLLSNAEKDNIEEHAGFLYLCCWQDDILRLRVFLLVKHGLASILMTRYMNFVIALRWLLIEFLQRSLNDMIPSYLH